MMEGEKMGSHQKGFLKLKHLSPLKMFTSLYLKRLLDPYIEVDKASS
jgi:hypothetical protein